MCILPRYHDIYHVSYIFNFYLRLLAHSDDAEPSPEPFLAESAPLVSDTPNQDNLADTSGQEISSDEAAKSMKCDVYVELQRL